VKYLEDHYAQQMWTPKEFEWGRKGFKPSGPVLGHFEASYTHQGIDAIT